MVIRSALFILWVLLSALLLWDSRLPTYVWYGLQEQAESCLFWHLPCILQALNNDLSYWAEKERPMTPGHTSTTKRQSQPTKGPSAFSRKNTRDLRTIDHGGASSERSLTPEWLAPWGLGWRVAADCSREKKHDSLWQFPQSLQHYYCISIKIARKS